MAIGQMGSTAAGWVYEYDITAAGEKTFIAKTENKFVDNDINVIISTPSSSAPTLSLAEKTAIIDMGTASNGVYSPVVDLSGTVNIDTAGWINATTYNVMSGTGVGRVNQSTMSIGNTAVASGSTITPSDSSQTITISEGYNGARTLIIGAADSGAAGAITSGSATIDALSYSYSSTNGYFTVSGSGDVSAPTVDSPGYISTTKGTKSINVGGASVSAVVKKIGLQASLTGATTARKPSISKNAINISGVVDAASGNAQTTAPSAGVYVAVQSAANTATITAAPSVATAGYGDATNYGATNATATVGAASSDVTYIPITTTSASVEGRTVSYGSGWITEGSLSVGTGSVTSGAGSATISEPTYNAGSDAFVQTASGAIAAPIVNSAGYISTTEGTRTGNSISGSKSLSVVGVGVTLSNASPSFSPTISRQTKPSSETWVDAANGAAVTTTPTSGAYVKVTSSSGNQEITATGKVSSAGYGTVDHYDADTASTATVTINSATSYVPIKTATITSGTGTINSVSVDYDNSNSKFNVTGSANVSAPTISSEGYVSSTIGTKNIKTGGAAVNAQLDQIGLTATISGTGTKQPTITKNAATNIPQAGTATTTAPSGYYIAVSSAANTGTVNAMPSVTSEGYGTTSHASLTSSANFTVGASASATTYIPITQASFANTASSGVTYTDISASAPVLISGDYLYINAGYTPNQKISLAQLVPDAAGVNATADYILSGYTAYNNDGTLITGNIVTYAGDYEIV